MDELLQHLFSAYNTFLSDRLEGSFHQETKAIFLSMPEDGTAKYIPLLESGRGRISTSKQMLQHCAVDEDFVDTSDLFVRFVMIVEDNNLPVSACLIFSCNANVELGTSFDVTLWYFRKTEVSLLLCRMQCWGNPAAATGAPILFAILGFYPEAAQRPAPRPGSGQRPGKA